MNKQVVEYRIEKSGKITEQGLAVHMKHYPDPIHLVTMRYKQGVVWFVYDEWTKQLLGKEDFANEYKEYQKLEDLDEVWEHLMKLKKKLQEAIDNQ